MQAPLSVIILRSASRNFPLDLEPELRSAGYSVITLASLQEYIASPARQQPQIVLLEIGERAEVERAASLIDWSEHVQPFAAVRYLILLASKNLSLSEFAARLAAAEAVVLPQPIRNLLFKLELQGRLLRAASAAARKPGEGFSAKLEEVSQGAGRKRVLALRGREPRDGSWRDSGNTPSGKVRWRWVSAPVAAPPPAAAFTWTAESRLTPRFDEKLGAFVLEGEDDDLVCQSGGETVFSARATLSETASEPESSVSSATADGAAVPSVRVPPAPSPAAAPGLEARSAPTVSEKPAVLAAAGAASPAEAPAGPTAAPREVPEKKQSPAPPKEPASPSTAQPPREGPAAAASPSAEGAAAKRSLFDKARDVLQEPEEAPPPERGATGQPAEAPWNVGDTAAASPESHAVTSPSGAGAPFREGITVRAGTPAPEPVPAKAAGTGVPGATPASAGGAGQPGAKGSPPGERAGRESSAPDEKAARPRADEPPGGEAPAAARAPREKQPLPSLGEPVPDISPAVPASTTERTSRPGKEPGEKTPAPPSVEAAPRSRAIDLPADAFEHGPPPAKEARASPAAAPAARGEGDSGKAAPAPALRPAAAGAEPNEPRAAAPPKSEAPAIASPDPAPRRAPQPAPAKAEAPAEQPEPASAPEPAGDDARRYLKHRHFQLLTLQQLGDQESSWHPAGRYRIYLSARHRYYGLGKPEAALPLWVYDGELAPEFIDEQAAWKFYDRPPVCVGTLEGLPTEAFEALYRLCGLTPPATPAPNPAGPAVVIVDAKAAPAARAPADPYQPEDGSAGRKKGAWSKLVRAVKKAFGG